MSRPLPKQDFRWLIGDNHWLAGVYGCLWLLTSVATLPPTARLAGERCELRQGNESWGGMDF